MLPGSRRIVEAWRTDSTLGAAVRGALLPAAGLMRGIIAVRNRLYDRGTLRMRASPIATVSVGNIAVGGAGKTPVAAWLARELSAQGAAPGIVMRGYGGDEPLVHRELNPELPVFVYPNRAAGVRAAARVGCDVAVLDDAFQHRRAARDEDIVLVSADSWGGAMALLPAGPWREPITAVRRASLVMITVKAASADTVAELSAGLAALAPALPVAVARIAPHSIRSFRGGAVDTMASLRGRRVLAVAAVADPKPFFLQLERAGATVTRRAYADHHVFSRRDTEALRTAASRHDLLVCTLKDAVKLRTLWPPDAAPAWYVSQTVSVEDGAEAVASLIRRLLAARRARAAETR